MKRTLLFVWHLCLCALFSNAQVSIISPNTNFTQNFNGLANTGSNNTWTNNTTISGWYSNRTNYAADNGSNGAVGMYSYGSTGSTERALGQIVGSGTPNRVFFGVRFINNTGSPITSIYVTYTGEQWRVDNAGLATLDFQYQITTTFTNITTGTFTDFNPLDFTSVKNNTAASALDGNNSSNRTVKHGIIKFPTPIANNGELILRWALPNNPSQHGLAIDDLTVNFAVNNNQHIPAGTVLENLEVNGFDVTPDGTLTITNSLTLTQGIVHTTAANLLTLNDNASAIGASNASFVDGPVQKIGNDVFTFPVGKNGKYVPIEISAPTNTTDAFTAEYIPESGAALGPVSAPGLLKVSSCEYWTLDRTTGSSNVDVTLSWDEDNACSGPSYIIDPPSIVVAHFNGTSWNSYGGSGTGSTASGSVTWDDVSEFSPFTFGTTSDLNALPVHFANVKAIEKSNGVQVEFTNLTESDLDYYEIERSTDRQGFSAIKRIAPEKNDYGSATYTYLDGSAQEGRNVYRVKAVETTGKIVYSNLISITVGAKSRSLSVYARGSQMNVQVNNLPAGLYQFKIFNATGQLISAETINHAGGSISQTKPLNNAKAGVYIYSIDGPVQMKKKFVVQ